MLRKMLSKIKFLKKIYSNMKEGKKIRGKHFFLDNGKKRKKLCIILAGYKEYLWDEVFERIKRFANDQIDICIVSSGVYSEKLLEIAKKNEWSYLSTKANKVTLAQNIAIDYFKEAEFIYKLDEDIFICENYFENLEKTYHEVEEKERYKIGFVAPLLPINGYGHIRVLEKLNLLEDYENKFGRTYYNSHSNNKVMVDVDTARYMWNVTYHLDEISQKFSKEDFQYSVCPCRFSIGAIYFSRELFESMGKFDVDKTNGLGKDEMQLCSYCVISSNVMVISENTLAGHFCFGPQNDEMKKLYEQNKMFQSIIEN